MGDLDVLTASRGETMLFQQMQIYPNIAFVYCGSARAGEFFGIICQPDTGELQLSYGNSSNQFLRENYSLDVRKNRLHWLSQSAQTYDARTRPWFHRAVSDESPVWTDVYLAFSTGLPTVTASLPVYDNRDRDLLGVCAADVVLPEEFRSFLGNLRIGQSGQAFGVDWAGRLISSSSDEPLMIGNQDRPQFLDVVNSQDPVVKGSAAYLLEHFGNLRDIRTAQQLTYGLNGKRHF